MIDLRMIDVAIGIVFLYLLVSMVCSIIREAIENILNRRAANLEEAIRELLGEAERTPDSAKDDRLGIDKLYNHSLISILYSGKYTERPGNRQNRSGDRLLNLKKIARLRHLPSYIPSSTFALALIDLVARSSGKGQSDSSAPLTIESLRQNVDKIQNPTVKGALQVALDNADGKLEQVRESIETWFNTAMDAVSARYRRNTSFIIFGIALIVSVGINVDTFRIADYLYRNTAVRDALVAMATEAAKRDDLPGFTAAKSALEATELPIGWRHGDGPKLLRVDTENRWTRENFFELSSFIVGWLVTSFAVTLGAPFWFDVLKRFSQARINLQPSKSSSHQDTPEKSKNVQTVVYK